MLDLKLGLSGMIVEKRYVVHLLLCYQCNNFKIANNSIALDILCLLALICHNLSSDAQWLHWDEACIICLKAAFHIFTGKLNFRQRCLQLFIGSTFLVSQFSHVS